MNVTTRATQYRSLAENSAAHFGEIAARSVTRLGDLVHPGDNIGGA